MLFRADEGWFVDVLVDFDVGVIADFESFLSGGIEVLAVHSFV